jgi:hypothetical protein
MPNNAWGSTWIFHVEIGNGRRLLEWLQLQLADVAHTDFDHHVSTGSHRDDTHVLVNRTIMRKHSQFVMSGDGFNELD